MANFFETAWVIQPYTPVRAHEIADLFYQAVHAIDPAVYTLQQQEAWAPTPPDYAHWAARLAQTQPWLALAEERVAGFIELVADGYIDCCYTHPEFQRQGVAAALYRHLLAEAQQRGLVRLSVKASLLARPFFAKRGFVQVSENQVQRKDVMLTHFTMEKNLVERSVDTSARI